MSTIRSRRRPLRRGANLGLSGCRPPIILAFVAIAIDGGGLLELRRKSQATADAAAMAAAEDLFRNYPQNKGLDTNGTALGRALAIASSNGFANNGTNSTVNVRFSPQTYASG